MVRPSRRPAHWLLWLVIALLPLRGWAWAQMAPAAIPGTPVSATTTSLPCHAAAVLETDAAATPAGEPSAPAKATTGCSHCVVCQGGLAGVPRLDLPGLLPHSTPPVAGDWTPRRDAPQRALYRPPRARLA